MTDVDSVAPAHAARVVDKRYRLQASDLHGRAVQAQIVNVSFQGVEELQVVLHLEGVAKSLVLTPTQRSAIVQLLHGSTFDQWIGQTITLRPLHVESAQVIEIVAVPQTKTTMRLGSRPPRPQKPRFNKLLAGLAAADSTINSYLAGLLILLVLGLLFGITYLLENPGVIGGLLGN